MAKLEVHINDGAVIALGWVAVAAVLLGFTMCCAVTHVADADVKRACVHKTGHEYCRPQEKRSQ